MPPGPIAETFRRKVLPATLWGVLVAGAFVMWRGMGPGLAVRGFAEAIPYQLSSVEPARVESLLVKLGDRVQQGQVVAILDARAIDGELRAAEAEKARVLAEIAKTEIETRATRVDSLRGIAGNRAEVERSLREAKTRLETARAELNAVKSELSRQRQNVKDGLMRASDLADLEIRRVALTRNVSEETAAVKVYEAQSVSASELGTTDEPSWVEAAVAPLYAELKVFEGQARSLEARRDQHILRAPADGQVSAVHGRAESTITPGLSFIEIMPDTSGRIMVCLTEEVHAPVGVGIAVTARPQSARDRELRGRAVSVGPVTELPSRCWREARTPMWGRLVTVELSPPTLIVPGESFEVRFEPDGG